MDRKLKISTCNKRTDLIYQNQEISWSELIDRLSKTTRTSETVEEYYGFSKDKQSDIKDVGGYVLGELKDGKRRATNIICRSAICLDLDFAPWDVWERFVKKFNFAAVVYSTHKHKPSSPKFRLIIPLGRDVDGEEYEYLARIIAASSIKIDWCDDTTFQPSRMMFWPSTSKDGKYIFEHQDKDFIDPDKVFEAHKDWKDRRTWPTSSRDKKLNKKVASSVSTVQDPTKKEGPVGLFCRTYTIRQVIDKFLPDIYEPTNFGNRFTYSRGESSAGLVVYNDIYAYSHHMSDPAGDGHCQNAFDITRIHLFGRLDEKSEAKGKNLPSYKAMVELVNDDEECQKRKKIEMFGAVIERQPDADKTEISKEQFEKDNQEWQSNLTVRQNGQIEDTIDNLVTILSNDTKLKGIGGMNDFKCLPEKSGSLPWWKWNPGSSEWSDDDDSNLRRYIEKIYRIRNRGALKDARTIVFRNNSFHPVKAYLDGLKWDGVERLDTVLIDYLGAQDNEYVRAVTRKTITAAVKRIYEPGCKFDYVLTLAGPQGCGKSQLVRTLASDEWLNDSLQTFQGKEAYETLCGSWFVEVAELTANKRSEVEQTKQFISKQEDKFRKAYAENVGVFRRQCVFIGTTNSDNFLRDMTGNRRWWIVGVEKSKRLSIFNDLPANRDQIFAEAKYRYQHGEELRLSDELENKANAIQEDYRFRSVWEDQIVEYLDTKLPVDWEKMDIEQRCRWLKNGGTTQNPGVKLRTKVCLMEIWCEVLDGTPANFSKIEQREIADVLHSLGWKKGGNTRFPIYKQQRTYIRL